MSVFVSKIPVYFLMGSTMAVMAGCGGHSSSMTEPEIPKAKMTEEIKQAVHEAKIAKDNGGVPETYIAVHHLQDSDRTIKLTPSGDVPRLNLSDLPMGRSQGTFVDSIDGEEEARGRFMSYQQFYSGIYGNKNTEVKFDEWKKRDEAFDFLLPVGLLTQAEGVPNEYGATYIGSAINGDHFGEFRYEIDFKDKKGKGGSITWEGEHAPHNITLEGNVALKDTLLAAIPDATDFGGDFYHHGIGVSGKATIEGQEGDFHYDAVLFGPKGEELTGLVYEKIEHDHDYDHDHDHDHDHGHDHDHDYRIEFGDDDHHGHDHEDRRNIAAFSGQR